MENLKKCKYKHGDRVIHSVFGTGIVISNPVGVGGVGPAPTYTWDGWRVKIKWDSEIRGITDIYDENKDLCLCSEFEAKDEFCDGFIITRNENPTEPVKKINFYGVFGSYDFYVAANVYKTLKEAHEMSFSNLDTEAGIRVWGVIKRVRLFNSGVVLIYNLKNNQGNLPEINESENEINKILNI